jgi:hypothetical protein
MSGASLRLTVFKNLFKGHELRLAVIVADLFSKKTFFVITNLSFFKGSGLLWEPKGAAYEARGLDQTERIPHLHHIIQAGHPGPQQLQAVQVAVPHPR